MADNPQTAAAMRALNETLAAAAREAGAAQALLQSAIPAFRAVSERVIGVVGGSAQRVDDQMVQSLQDALRHSSHAIAALAAAGASTRAVK